MESPLRQALTRCDAQYEGDFTGQSDAWVIGISPPVLPAIVGQFFGNFTSSFLDSAHGEQFARHFGVPRSMGIDGHTEAEILKFGLASAANMAAFVAWYRLGKTATITIGDEDIRCSQVVTCMLVDTPQGSCIGILPSLTSCTTPTTDDSSFQGYKMDGLDTTVPGLCSDFSAAVNILTFAAFTNEMESANVILARQRIVDPRYPQGFAITHVAITLRDIKAHQKLVIWVPGLEQLDPYNVAANLANAIIPDIDWSGIPCDIREVRSILADLAANDAHNEQLHDKLWTLTRFGGPLDPVYVSADEWDALRADVVQSNVSNGQDPCKYLISLTQSAAWGRRLGI